MNGLQMILESEAIERLGWALVHSLWIGAAIAAALGLTLLGLRRRSAQARYVASCAALAAMVAGTAAAWFCVRPAETAAVAALPAPAVIAAQPADGTEGTAGGGNELTPMPLRAVEAPLVLPAARAVAAPAEAWSVRVRKMLEPALPWVVLAWGVGVAAMGMWQLAGWMAAVRIRKLATVPSEPGVVLMVERIARAMRLGRPVAVMQSMLVKVPTLIGWLRPVILLPAGLATGLSNEQLEAIVMHELAHVRRMDYLVNLLQRLVEAILFYHPAVWFISRQIRIERENCCDDVTLAACGDATVYAEALLAVAGPKAPRMALAASGGKLLPRVRRILGMSNGGTGASAWVSGVLALMLIAAMVAVPMACSVSPTNVPPTSEKKETVIPGAWGEPTDGLRGRWIPPAGPVFTGIRPEVTVELENAGNQLVFWQCMNEISWLMGVDVVPSEGSMTAPRFRVIVDKGVRLATADEVSQKFGIGNANYKGNDPMPGFYAFSPGGKLRLRATLPEDFAKPGRYEVDGEVARLNLTTNNNYERSKAIISCPPMVLNVVAAVEVPEFHDIDSHMMERDLKALVEKRGLKQIAIHSGSPGGLPIQTIYHIYRSDGENVKVTFPKDKSPTVERLAQDAWYADKLFNGLEKAAKGLQVTLRAEKDTCQSIDDLHLLADIRNTGAGEVALFNDGSTGWDLEVDGQIYVSEMMTSAHAFMIGAGEEWKGLEVPEAWMRKAIRWHIREAHKEGEVISLSRSEDIKPLVLSPGKHTIRVAVYPMLDSGSSEVVTFPDNPSRMALVLQLGAPRGGRALSNAIEINVTPATTTKAALDAGTQKVLDALLASIDDIDVCVEFEPQSDRKRHSLVLGTNDLKLADVYIKERLSKDEMRQVLQALAAAGTIGKTHNIAGMALEPMPTHQPGYMLEIIPRKDKSLLLFSSDPSARALLETILPVLPARAGASVRTILAEMAEATEPASKPATQAAVATEKEAAKELGMTPPIVMDHIDFYRDGGTIGITLRDANRQTARVILSAMWDLRFGSDDLKVKSHPVTFGSREAMAIRTLLQAWADTQMEREKQPFLLSKNGRGIKIDPGQIDLLGLLEVLERIDIQHAAKTLGRTFAMCSPVKAEVFADGGTIHLMLGGSGPDEWPICLDGRKPAAGQADKPRHLFVGAAHPTDPAARELPIDGDEERAIRVMLHAWLDGLMTRDQQAALLARPEGVEGLSVWEVRKLRTLQLLQRVDSRGRKPAAATAAAPVFVTEADERRAAATRPESPTDIAVKLKAREAEMAREAEKKASSTNP